MRLSKKIAVLSGVRNTFIIVRGDYIAGRRLVGRGPDIGGSSASEVPP